MTTTKLLSLTLLLAATMGVCGVSSAEEVKDSTNTEIVSVEDSDLRNEDALRVAVGDFDDVEFLLSAEEMETIADNVYISFNGVRAQGGGVSGSSSSSAEASGQVETTENSSTTFSGALTLASATSEMVTVRQSSVAMSMISDNSTEQYAEDAWKSYYEQVSTSNSGSAVTTYSATSFLGNSNSVGDGDGSYGTSTLSNSSGIVPYATTRTWKGTSGTVVGDETYYYWSTSANWSGAWSNGNNATFSSSTGSTIVTVDTNITATELTVQGGTDYTFNYEEGAVLTVTSTITIDEASSLTITGGTNIFGDSTSSDYVYIGWTSSSSKSGSEDGSLIITGGTTTFTCNNIFVGHQYNSGSITIGSVDGNDEDLTVTFNARHLYIGRNSNGTGSLTINSGVNTFNCDVILGYNDKNSEGTLTIAGGTNIFEGSIEIGYTGTGTMTITGGNTTIKGATTISNTGSLTIGDNEATGKATVYLETQIGTTTTGDVTITGNAEIIISGDLLEKIADLAESSDGGSVAVICANTITFGDVSLSDYDGDLGSLINPYISADGYNLTWSYSNSTLWVVAAVVATPEPELFSVFFGIGALGLIATRRRRRKVA